MPKKVLQFIVLIKTFGGLYKDKDSNFLLMMIKGKNTKRKHLSFKLLLLMSLIIVVLFAPALFGEAYRNYQIDREIGSLKSEIEAMEKNNYELAKLVEYYNTDEFREAEARKRLGLKGEGERVVVIKPGAESSKIETVGVEIINNDNYPNYLKWWDYFFKKKN